MKDSSVIKRLFVGKAAPLERPGYDSVPSGIVKYPKFGAVYLSLNGLKGDEQGDKRYHGGPEKALHHYASEHYLTWRSMLPLCPVPLMPGAFGENLSTAGMTEQSVCIGDVYQIGSAVVQVSQGRQPCWKLNRRLEHSNAALLMQRMNATGWYYRVLQEGFIEMYSEIELMVRPCPDWPMQRLISALFPEGAVTPELMEEWRLAAEIEQLSSNWRNTFARRVSSQQIEDWTSRLYEPQSSTNVF